MKILEVTPFLSPVHGGSAEVPYHISKELAKRGHDVTIYSSDSRLKKDYVNSIPAVRVNSFPTWLSPAKFYVTPDMISRTREELKKFDVIHLHNYRTFQNIIVHHYAKKHGVPYVLQAHGSLATFFQRGWLKRTFDIVWGDRLVRDAAGVIAVTRAEGMQFEETGLISKDKISVVPYGIDASEFEKLPPKGGFIKKQHLNPQQKTVLYLGRIDKIKGLDLLARAFAQVSNRLKDVRLVIAGPDYGYRSTLSHLIKELKIEGKVIFTGALYGEDKLEAYIDADVYILPSSYEIFGITVLEALACGTPVIVTDRCGVAEAIDGKAGMVIPYDGEQLQSALSQILQNDQLRQELGEKGRRLVIDKFTWQKIVEEVEKVYQEYGKH